MTATTWTLTGVTMQTIGTALLTLPLWLPRTWVPLFDTSEAMLVDRQGWVPWFVRIGLVVYLLGYVPIILGTR